MLAFRPQKYTRKQYLFKNPLKITVGVNGFQGLSMTFQCFSVIFFQSHFAISPLFFKGTFPKTTHFSKRNLR